MCPDSYLFCCSATCAHSSLQSQCFSDIQLPKGLGFSVVQLFLITDAVNGEQGHMPLHAAVRSNYSEGVSVLLGAGARVNELAHDQAGMTSLHIAAMLNRTGDKKQLHPDFSESQYLRDRWPRLFQGPLLMQHFVLQNDLIGDARIVYAFYEDVTFSVSPCMGGQNQPSMVESDVF